jgi:hypothetical protein
MPYALCLGTDMKASCWNHISLRSVKKSSLRSVKKTKVREETFLTLLLYMCPHTALCVSSYSCDLLLYMCPHTALCVSSYCYICVLILLYMCPHTALYVSSYCSACVLILLYMCPPTSMHARVLLLSLYVKVSCEDRATQ